MDRSTCKNETEIDDFIDKNGHMFFIANEQIYNKEDYSDDVVT